MKGNSEVGSIPGDVRACDAVFWGASFVGLPDGMDVSQMVFREGILVSCAFLLSVKLDPEGQWILGLMGFVLVPGVCGCGPCSVCWGGFVSVPRFLGVFFGRTTQRNRWSAVVIVSTWLYSVCDFNSQGLQPCPGSVIVTVFSNMLSVVATYGSHPHDFLLACVLVGACPLYRVRFWVWFLAVGRPATESCAFRETATGTHPLLARWAGSGHSRPASTSAFASASSLPAFYSSFCGEKVMCDEVIRPVMVRVRWVSLGTQVLLGLGGGPLQCPKVRAHMWCVSSKIAGGGLLAVATLSSSI